MTPSELQDPCQSRLIAAWPTSSVSETQFTLGQAQSTSGASTSTTQSSNGNKWSTTGASSSLAQSSTGASQSGAQSSTDNSVSGTQSTAGNQQFSSAPRSQAGTNVKTNEFQVGGDDTYEEKSDSLSIWSIVLKALAFLSLLIIIKAFVFKKFCHRNQTAQEKRRQVSIPSPGETAA
ncbi:protein rtoA-like [Pocillopora verrucosa]|uniref:protein rtoA-like n=1 Tax=Pocillopora verrucosa TaxID=203993 RepID=UPI00333E792F